MYIKWTQHIQDQTEKAEFERSILGSRDVLRRLKTILQEEEDGLIKAELSPKSFDTPNWSEKQAYYNGYKACLHQLKKLVDLDQQKGPISE